MKLTIQRFSLHKRSKNRKTGDIPLVSACRSTCWKGCPFYGCCYGKQWPMLLQWSRVENSGVEFPVVREQILSLEKGAVWRWGDVGDLPGQDENLDVEACLEIARANAAISGRGFAYTHKPAHLWAGVFREMNKLGFCVNLSVEGLHGAKNALKWGLPLVTVLPRGTEWKSLSVNGTRIVRCPAEISPIQCRTCGGSRGPLCARDRNFIIGLTAHGFSNKIERAIAENERCQES